MKKSSSARAASTAFGCPRGRRMRPSYEPLEVRCGLCGVTQAVNSAVNDVLGQPAWGPTEA